MSLSQIMLLADQDWLDGATKTIGQFDPRRHGLTTVDPIHPTGTVC